MRIKGEKAIAEVVSKRLLGYYLPYGLDHPSLGALDYSLWEVLLRRPLSHCRADPLHDDDDTSNKSRAPQ